MNAKIGPSHIKTPSCIHTIQQKAESDTVWFPIPCSQNNMQNIKWNTNMTFDSMLSFEILWNIMFMIWYVWGWTISIIWRWFHDESTQWGNGHWHKIIQDCAASVTLLSGKCCSVNSVTCLKQKCTFLKLRGNVFFFLKQPGVLVTVPSCPVREHN